MKIRSLVRRLRRIDLKNSPQDSVLGVLVEIAAVCGLTALGLLISWLLA